MKQPWQKHIFPIDRKDEERTPLPRGEPLIVLQKGTCIGCDTRELQARLHQSDVHLSPVDQNGLHIMPPKSSSFYRLERRILLSWPDSAVQSSPPEGYAKEARWSLWVLPLNTCGRVRIYGKVSSPFQTTSDVPFLFLFTSVMEEVIEDDLGFQCVGIELPDEK